jgi:hypothetical protein
VSDLLTGVIPFVPGPALVPPTEILERITDPRVLAGLLRDGEWRTVADWRESKACLKLRRCGEEAPLEARLVML